MIPNSMTPRSEGETMNTANWCPRCNVLITAFGCACPRTDPLGFSPERMAQGEADIEAGRVKSAVEVFDSLRQRLPTDDHDGPCRTPPTAPGGAVGEDDRVKAAISAILEHVGAYGLNCHLTGELAPTTEFMAAFAELGEAHLAAVRRAAEQARECCSCGDTTETDRYCSQCHHGLLDVKVEQARNEVRAIPGFAMPPEGVMEQVYAARSSPAPREVVRDILRRLLPNLLLSDNECGDIASAVLRAADAGESEVSTLRAQLAAAEAERDEWKRVATDGAVTVSEFANTLATGAETCANCGQVSDQLLCLGDGRHEHCLSSTCFAHLRRRLTAAEARVGELEAEVALRQKRLDAGFPYGICCTKCNREMTGEPQFSGVIWPSGDPMRPEVHGIVCAECWTTHGTKVEDSDV